MTVEPTINEESLPVEDFKTKYILYTKEDEKYIEVEKSQVQQSSVSDLQA